MNPTLCPAGRQQGLGAPWLCGLLGLQVTSCCWAQGAVFSLLGTGVGTTWKIAPFHMRWIWLLGLARDSCYKNGALPSVRATECLNWVPFSRVTSFVSRHTSRHLRFQRHSKWRQVTETINWSKTWHLPQNVHLGRQKIWRNTIYLLLRKFKDCVLVLIFDVWKGPAWSSHLLKRYLVTSFKRWFPYMNCVLDWTRIWQGVWI